MFTNILSLIYYQLYMNVAIQISRSSSSTSINHIVNNKKKYDVYEINQNGANAKKNIVFADLGVKDLRKKDIDIFDEDKGFNISSIVVKDDAILIQLDYIRAVVLKNKAFLFMSHNISNDHTDQTNKLLVEIKKYFEEQNDPDNDHPLPFEIAILENVFVNVSNYYDDILDEIKPIFATFTNNLIHSNRFTEKLGKDLVNIQKRQINLHFKVKDIKERLQDILEWEEDDFQEFFISRKQDENIDTDIIEELIDKYKTFFEEYDDDLEKMSKLIDINLKNMNLHIAETRNNIARYNTKLSISTLGVTIANLISSAYGMNIYNYMENSDFAWFVVVGIMFILIFVVYWLCVKLFEDIEV
jgi:magnesium transporter